MKPATTFLILSAFAYAGSVHPQLCSGGPDGGMGPTGSQCDNPGDYGYGAEASARDRASSTGKVVQLEKAATDSDPSSTSRSRPGLRVSTTTVSADVNDATSGAPARNAAPR